MILLIALLLPACLLAQEAVVADGSMTPSFVEGRRYTVSDRPVGPHSFVAIIANSGAIIIRQVVGLPTDKQLAEDPQFVLRSLSTWQQFFVDRRAYWMEGPPAVPPPVREQDLDRSAVLFSMPYGAYQAASTLGDSLYYAHALNRLSLPVGATRSLAQGADSREFGLVHYNRIIGVIVPDDE